MTYALTFQGQPKSPPPVRRADQLADALRSYSHFTGAENTINDSDENFAFLHGLYQGLYQGFRQTLPATGRLRLPGGVGVDPEPDEAAEPEELILLTQLMDDLEEFGSVRLNFTVKTRTARGVPGTVPGPQV